ncbi:hypothetical protein B0T10DRAFT_546635 [Thelonectria olida]|uniref:NmrA-like domain-containing protein n=1 Tax=Thelonectria olida TaxID=1576542 RepID=A0A9P8W803_9HYPO|nr:hypothetical protein B0T10DRAFT_546635 [Thelonectria olida]
MSTIKVAIVGASGETGQSIINGLLKSSQDFTITALVRSASIDKPEVQQIKAKGVNIAPFELESSHEEQVKALAGQDVVICCIIPQSADLSNALADAAKAGGVKRFVPSFFGPVAPAYGVMALREIKEDVLNHIKEINLPYTIIDVGWWYQNTLPRLPSGKIDYAVKFPLDKVYGDGNLPTAVTDLRDIGTYVARIIADPRTLNAAVFAYNEIQTQEQILSLLESLSGESVPREYLSIPDLEAAIATAQATYDQDRSWMKLLGVAILQYPNSTFVRGDNLPGPAAKLGYMSGKELYPDVQVTKYADYVAEVVAGKGKAVYANRTFGFETK